MDLCIMPLGLVWWRELLSAIWDRYKLDWTNKKAGCRKETARCDMFLPTPNDSLTVIYIHCIKADVNVKQ